LNRSLVDRTKELLIKQQNLLTLMKRQMNMDDNDPFAQTLSFKDHIRKLNLIVL